MKKKLNQSALLVLQLLKDKKLTTDELTPRQRIVVVKYFMTSQTEFSNQNIADLLGVSDVHISRLKRKILNKMAWEIDATDVKIVAAELLMKKREFQRRAVESNDFALAWRIETDYIHEMQSFGFVIKAPERLDITTEGDFERKLKEFVDAYGVLDVDEFIDRLEAGVPGNGHGEGAAPLLLAAAAESGRSKKNDRRTPGNRPQN